MAEVRDESIHYYERHFSAVPELALIGHAVFSKASHVLEEHDHGSAMEVLSLSRGRQTFRSRGREYEMRGGGCVVFPPGAPHSTGGRPQGKAELRWIQIELGLPSPFFADARHQPLRDSLRAVATQTAAFPQDMWAALGRLYEIAKGGEYATRDSQVAALSLMFCHRLLEITERRNQRLDKRRVTPAIEQALEFMRSRIDRQLSVAEMAKSCGYTESAFTAAFKREVGLSPAEHFLRAKLDAAAEMLRGTDQSITAISVGLGFSSTQYFATAFRRHHMATPTEYRRSEKG